MDGSVTAPIKRPEFTDGTKEAVCAPYPVGGDGIDDGGGKDCQPDVTRELTSLC